MKAIGISYIKMTNTYLNPNKQEAKEQFERVTKQLGIKHTFSFDEVWDGLLKQRYRNNVVAFEKEVVKLPQALDKKQIDKVNPLTHTFADGLYIREIFNPKDELIITKIHKTTHPYFLLKGEMSILTEHGYVRVKAPHYGITKAGTKRIIRTHEDCVFVTVHRTNETDLHKIEDELIAKDFQEIKEEELICHL